jgi:hypothetical protein
MLTRSDWTLLAIDAAGREGLSPVQLQKTLFLLGKRLPSAVGSDWYDFQPYHYGPFDRKVYTDAERLAAKDEVEVIQRQGESWNRYALTRDGEIRTSYLCRENPDAVEYLKRLVEWVQQQTFQTLVTTIYAEYPEMRANSVFQG